MSRPSPEERARREAARAQVGRYHEQELRQLVDHLRVGLARLDRGEIDVFEFDEIVHRYKKAAQKLWSFCNISEAYVETKARLLEEHCASGDSIDWWQLAAPRNR